MRKRVTTGVAIAVFAGALAIPMLAVAGTGITAKLDAQEIVNPNGGDPNGSAKVRLKVNRVKQRICYRVKYTGLHKLTGSFIHKGDPGEIKRPIITLFEGNEKSPVRGCVNDVRKRVVKRLKRKPELHYVDVDTKKYPDGAIRGQLSD